MFFYYGGKRAGRMALLPTVTFYHTQHFRELEIGFIYYFFSISWNKR